MEKDIGIIENLKKYLQLLIDEGNHKIFYNDLGHDEKVVDCIQAIENILNRLEQDERVIEEMAEYMAREFPEYQLDKIYAELYNCNGLDRKWTRGEEEEIKDILKYFRKKCE